MITPIITLQIPPTTSHHNKILAFLIQHMRAVFLCAALILPATHSVAKTPASPPTLHLETFFNGKLTATGSFKNNLTGQVRTLTVTMQGTWITNANGTRIGRLKEDFTYDDGEKDQKTWVFTKVGEGHYQGTREDVIGTADILDKDGLITLDYVTRQKLGKASDSATLDLAFHDTIIASSKNSVRNTATVSLLIFPIGAVDLTITNLSNSAK